MINGPLFPGFKTPPNDESRDMEWKRKQQARVGLSFPPHEEEHFEPDPNTQDSDEDAWEREWCDTCANTGVMDCHCGGDQCICRNNGEYDCPDCS